MVNKNRICIIFGDFNLPYRKQHHHFVITELLVMGFSQLVDHPTHNRGNIIDLCFLFKPNEFEDVVIGWELYSPFYTDHFGICIKINKGKDIFKETESTLPNSILGQLRDSIGKDGNKSSKGSGKNQTATKRNKRTINASSFPPNKVLKR